MQTKRTKLKHKERKKENVGIRETRKYIKDTKEKEGNEK